MPSPIPLNLIEHVVVLMMENHSFDNMLGWLPNVGELTGTEYNESYDGTPHYTGDYKNPPFNTSPGPAHDFQDVNNQVMGKCYPGPKDPVTMSGFVLDYGGLPGPPGGVMGCYQPDQVPVITTLASNFTVCTRWFCSVPGPTGPNRIYANCATTLGYAGPCWQTATQQPNPSEQVPSEWSSLTSIFGVLGNTKKYNWGVYHEDSNFAVETVLSDVINGNGGSAIQDPLFQTFYQQVQNGALPNYSFLTPNLCPNSQHPGSDVRYGECLMANVYEVIRNSSYWENTLLIITYDEHGGFFDSIPTPTGVPNPDATETNPAGLIWDANCPPDYHFSGPTFAFTRLGVRVPAILISPYIPAGIDMNQYEHSSIVATVMKLFGLTWPVGNKRVETVNTFEGNIGTEMRMDLPRTLPRPPTSPNEDEYTPLPSPLLPPDAPPG